MLTSSVVLGIICVVTIEVVVILSERMVRPPLEGMENQVIDLAFQVRKTNNGYSRVKPEDVVIIDIDDASIAQMGRSQNWPRSYDARVINYIASGNPKGMGIDFLYTESDSLSGHYIEMLASKGIADPSQVAHAFSSDEELSGAIKNAGNVYLSLFDDDAITDSITDPATVASLQTFAKPEAVNYQFHTVSHPVLPIPAFAQYARATGAIAVPTMYDGTVRHYRLFQELPGVPNDQKLIANFTLYMAMDALGLEKKDLRFVADGVYIGDSIYVPLRKDGSFRINWLGNEEKIRHISYYKVWDEYVPAEYFEGKYVFFGTSASGLQDLKTVPYQVDKLPGVDVHANAFLNLMNGNLFMEISERDSIPWFVLISILLIFMFQVTRPLLGFVIGIGLYFGERFVFDLYIIPKLGIIFPISSLMLLTLLCYLTASLYTYFIRERRNRQLKSAFGTYVAPEIVEQIAKDPDALQLGGVKKELTVLFSDIRGFTSISEKMDPQQIVAVLNDYLSAMSDVIFRHRGTIDKFIGDAIMAVFGAPVAHKDHADRACHVALDMVDELEKVNAANKEEDIPPLRIGIGINTGEMTVGNIGSRKRFDYTVIGDPVNLGSRLEGITKFFDVQIIVSGSTKEATTPGLFLFRELGNIQVKGKDEAVTAYELLRREQQDPVFEQFYTAWMSSIAAMKSKDMTSALNFMETCESLRPGDKGVAYYLDKCRSYTSHPEDFDMIVKMESK